MLRNPTALFASLLALFAPLGLAGCGDDDGNPTDAGMTDTGPPPPDDGGMPMPDTGPMLVDLATCATPRVVMGEVGEVTVTGDTTRGRSGTLDLGVDCNNQEAMRWAPQEVIAYTVPGTGPMGITFTSVNPGTPGSFDTLIQLRTGECESIPDPGLVPTCFDDTSGMEFRSTGVTSAMGGDTIYLVFTGYSETPVEGGTDRGPYTVAITARSNDLPELTTGEVQTIGTRARVILEGQDDDGDALGFAARFLDAMGDPVDMDIDGDGALDGNEIAATFDEDLSGMMMFRGSTTLAGLGDAIRFAMPAAATQAEVQLIDDVFAFGPPAMVMVREVTEVELGEACDDVDRVCAPSLTCEMLVCAAPPAVAAACGAATAITIATPTTTTTTADVTGTIPMAMGIMTGTCADTRGAELIYTLDVPAGAFDLLLDSDRPGTGDTDTVVYVRRTCESPTTELACNDDIDTMGMMYGSRLEVRDVPPGVRAILVEQYGGGMAAGPFEMRVSLRPVLATGAACDMAGAMNRCAGGPCAAGTCP